MFEIVCLYEDVYEDVNLLCALFQRFYKIMRTFRNHFHCVSIQKFTIYLDRVHIYIFVLFKILFRIFSFVNMFSN